MIQHLGDPPSEARCGVVYASGFLFVCFVTTSSQRCQPLTIYHHFDSCENPVFSVNKSVFRYKNIQIHEQPLNGIQEVSGSIPLISTKIQNFLEQKATDFLVKSVVFSIFEKILIFMLVTTSSQRLGNLQKQQETPARRQGFPEQRRYTTNE